MAKKTEKTNAARLLDRAGISYDLTPYEFDENDLAAQHVADSLGQPIERVFKTLVLHGDRSGHIVCVVPGNGEVDLKALAKVSGNKKVEMIAMKDLLAVTGYIRGGCSPIGMKKKFPTYFHSTAMDFETIYVSAGVRGLQLEIAPEDLIGFVGGVVADVACF
jgi:Cys-tRNA(Pro)/Cys-tRNA(Cys) deacylase